MMYLLTKFGGHMSYGNGDINFYIISYMETLEKAEFITSICGPARFLKSVISIDILRKTFAEKQQEEEYKQLQSVLCFTQTQ